MPQVSTRRSKDDDELIEEEAEESKSPAGPVSDRRRRRLMKRGEPAAVIEPEAEEEDDEVVEEQVGRKEKPTPSTREVVKSRNPVVRFVQNVDEYLQETNAELRKVTWLSREDMMRLTYIVLIVTAVSAAFLGLVGFIFGLLTQALATSTSTIIAGLFLTVLIVVVTAAWLFRERLFGGHFE